MNEVRRSPAEYARPPVMRGPANPKYVEAVQMVCDHCGTTYSRKPWRANRADTRNRYCSRKCRDNHKRLVECGPDSPLWIGGQQTYRGRDWRRIRWEVVRSQCGTCAHCGKYVGRSLPVNHMRPYREFSSPTEANVRTNLLGLCQPCHMRAEPRRHRHGADPSKSSA